jgi:hypothetical protein
MSNLLRVGLLPQNLFQLWRSRYPRPPDSGSENRDSEPFQCAVQVLLADGGSVQEVRAADFQSAYSSLRGISTLRLRCNLGHQRAIAIGLVQIRRSSSCDALLVMDSDGVDTPEGAMQLLESFTGEKAIFAERSKRAESRRIQSFIRGDVLEVDAGVGSNTPFLDARSSGPWPCLGPDSHLNTSRAIGRRWRRPTSGMAEESSTCHRRTRSSSFDATIGHFRRYISKCCAVSPRRACA